MASTTFPLAQAGSFSFAGTTVKGFCVMNASLGVNQSIQDVTGTCFDGATWAQDKAKRWVHGVPTREFVLDGVVERLNLNALAQESTIVFGNQILMRTTQWTLRKRWPLDNVTGSGSADDAEWTWGMPVYSMTARGWATGPTGPTVNTQEEDITFNADEIGALSWTGLDAAPTTGSGLKLGNFGVRAPFSRGGSIPASFSGVFQENRAYTPGLNDFSWLFINAASLPDDPVKVTATLDTDGEVIVHSVLVYDVSFTWNGTAGGPVNIRVRCRFDKA